MDQSKMKENIDIAYLKNNDWLLFEAIAGSNAYGTNIPTSDIDRKGIFVLPRKIYYGLNGIEQVSDERNDNVYYELGRVIELLGKNNPNMLELLAMPKDCIEYKHPLFDRLKPELFLSKLCQHTFAGYAISQIKKARGLNKKIANPMPKHRKSILDFCYVVKAHGSISLVQWLTENDLNQQQCGLVKIANMRDTYAVFYDENNEFGYKGIMAKKTANQVSLSSIPKEEEKIAILSFNKDGYATYCTEYKNYWSWVEKRNEVRYENTISHGKNYDSKNMMHTFRLLDMAEEIAVQKSINVLRPNRKFLLQIRNGDFEYDDLLQQAEEKVLRIKTVYEKCDLPEKPDWEEINQLLVEIREEWYE